MDGVYDGKHRHMLVAEIVTETLKVFDKHNGQSSVGWNEMVKQQRDVVITEILTFETQMKETGVATTPTDLREALRLSIVLTLLGSIISGSMMRGFKEDSVEFHDMPPGKIELVKEAELRLPGGKTETTEEHGVKIPEKKKGSPIK